MLNPFFGRIFLEQKSEYFKHKKADVAFLRHRPFYVIQTYFTLNT